LSLFLVYYYINKTQYEVVPQTNISGLVENTDVATFFNSLEGNRSGIYEAGLGQTYAFVHVDYQNKSVDYTFNVTVTEAPNS
jgi:hypothetical protein